jgi:Zn-dependent protease
MRFTEREIKEILISAVIIGYVFAWYFERGIPGINSIAIALVGVGAAFIFHELAHKYTAQKYGCWAEYRMWETGLIIAFFSVVVFGFVFAAPGAVYISPGMYGITRRQNGIISVSGAVSNLTLAVIFLIIKSTLGVVPWINDVATMGIFINAWLALFNMLPLPPLDGSKVRAWDTKVWIGVIVGALVLMNLA